MGNDSLGREIEAVQGWVQGLRLRAEQGRERREATPATSLEVLLNSFQELRAADEERQRQNEELAASRAALEAHNELERRVEECTAELRTSNEQLRENIKELERAEAALAERLRFETLLSELSTEFLNLPPTEVDSGIERGLQRIAEFLGVDRSTLFILSEGETDVRATHSWTLPGCDPAPRLLTLDHFPWATEKLRRGETILVSRVDHLPDEASGEKEHFLREGAKSAVVIPLAVAGSVLGAASFADLRSERSWAVGLVQRLRLVGEIFANALTRKQAEESLQEAVSEIQRLQQQLQAENLYLREEIKLGHTFDEVIGQGNDIKYVLFKVEQVAPSDTSVLLLGETGTGKELLARAIHSTGPRKGRPLVKVNCAVLPAHLIESELFGHEQGAFTGAHAKRVGRFELADGGTLFLDEIGELPLELQAKLLRVLQDGEFERLGSPETMKVDVRVIAATSRDLKAEIANGRFRADLYYRLHVFPISLPPLRERREDIPLLVRSLVKKFGEKLGKTIHAVPMDAMEALQNYPWPGNVRELENVIERAVINTEGATLRLMDSLVAPQAADSPETPKKTLQQVEMDYVLQTLEETQWRIEGQNGAAEALGLNPSTLRGRMQKLGIQRPKARNRV